MIMHQSCYKDTPSHGHGHRVRTLTPPGLKLPPLPPAFPKHVALRILICGTPWNIAPNFCCSWRKPQFGRIWVFQNLVKTTVEKWNRAQDLWDWFFGSSPDWSKDVKRTYEAQLGCGEHSALHILEARLTKSGIKRKIVGVLQIAAITKRNEQ